jgi:formylmethanofuran dehydrogenase subunit E
MSGLSEYCAAAIVDADGDELVTENNKCPHCGERRMDYLEWDFDGDKIICATCLTEYRI